MTGSSFFSSASSVRSRPNERRAGVFWPFFSAAPLPGKKEGVKKERNWRIYWRNM